MNNIGNNYPKQYYIYLPENLDLDKIYELSPPENKFHVDYAKYICNIITSIKVCKTLESCQNDFTPINKKVLYNRVRKYKEVIKWLIENDIVEESKHYIPSQKSGGLRFKTKYLTKVTRKTITKYTLIKNLINHYNKEKEKEFQGKETYQWLEKWLLDEKFTINYKDAIAHLESVRSDESKQIDRKLHSGEINQLTASLEKRKSLNRYNIHYIVVDRIKSKRFTFLVDDMGRFHTQLSRLKKGLREFIRYDGQELTNIDIVNSQPFMSLALLDINSFQRNNIMAKVVKYNPTYDNKKYDRPNELIATIKKNSNKEDTLRYKQSASDGKFYEEFKKALDFRNISLDQDNREAAKTAAYTAMFCHNSSVGFNKYLKAFKDIFPSVYEVFSLVKKSKHDQRALACTLQDLESELVIKKTVYRITTEFPEIPIFTIHDSIATTSMYEEVIRNIFEEELYLAIGRRPELNTDKWVQKVLP